MPFHLEALEDRTMPAADFYNAVQGQQLDVLSAALGVLANDTPTGYPATLAGAARHGTVNLNGDGTFTYTPEIGFSGTDWFAYRTTPWGSPVFAEVVVQPDAVWATDDAFAVSHGGSLTDSVTANDPDISDRPLAAQLVTGPAHGALTLNGSGTFTYTPAGGYVGPDAFTYRLSDGVIASAAAAVSLAVTNDPPAAQPDAYAVGHGQSLVVGAAGGVLADDTDADGDPVSASLVSGPAHGSLALNADGTFTYTPAAGYVGPDSFTYRASDGRATADAVVSLDVTNDAPATGADAYRVLHDTPLTVAAADGVLANDADPDGDPMTAVLTQVPAHGTVALRPDGSFTYTPAAGFVGDDEFLYAATDGRLTGTAVEVRVTVENPPPVANDDEYDVYLTGPFTALVGAGVLANDTTDPGETLTAQLVTGPAHGTLALSASGSFTYTPAAGFTGDDAFTYTASDGRTASDPVTVTLHVIDTVPVGADDSYTLPHDRVFTAPVGAGVLANDTTDPGETLTAQLVTGPAHGTLAL
ncbi:MAG TPA: Ig-like domain-containing protein, partial [Urbifossiella sp.]|nr:Ig-like domain-containing protein [Urbifossiella sp.]